MLNFEAARAARRREAAKDPPLTIVHVTPWWVDDTGGPSTYVKHLGDAQRRLGHRVEVVTWGSGPGARRVHANPLLAFKDIYQSLREWKPDVVQIHSRSQGIAPAVLYRRLERPDSKVIYTFHTMPYVRRYLDVPCAEVEPRGGARQRATDALLAQCDVLTSVSHSIVEAIQDHHGSKIRDYRVIRSGCDVAAFAAADVASARARWVPEGRGPILASVGVLAWDWKVAGHDLCLLAVDRLRAKLPGIQLLIAGDGPYRRWLENRVRRFHLEDNVRLLGNVGDVAGVLAASDVYVHMALNEGSPHALIEAMASAKPIVAARAGGIPELIEDGHSGLLVHPDPAPLAGAISKILDDPRLGALLGRNAAEFARSELTWERAANASVAVYMER